MYLKQYRILDSDLNSENDKKCCQNKKSIELLGMKINHEDREDSHEDIIAMSLATQISRNLLSFKLSHHDDIDIR